MVEKRSRVHGLSESYGLMPHAFRTAVVEEWQCLAGGNPLDDSFFSL